MAIEPIDRPSSRSAPAGRSPAAFSLEGKLAAVALGGVALALTLAGLGSLLPLPRWLVFLMSFGLVFPLSVLAVQRVARPIRSTLTALSDGIRSFRDGDFSVRIAEPARGELRDLIGLYNEVGQVLQDERSQIRQRELLLQSALDQSPIAIVLTNPLDRVVYANVEARRLFLGGDKLEGRRFDEILRRCPAPMREVLDSSTDGIFTLEQEDRTETYHLSQRSFHLNRFRHSLYLLRRMTPELARQEAAIWKKIIRIMSHEINNSLAPISSLAHSGLQIARKPEELHRLEPVYRAIRERIDHLTQFLEGYARFARLPEPRKTRVDWSGWLEGPRKLYAFDLVGRLPGTPGYFDPAQLEQVLINLLKNAVEASDGEPRIELQIDRLPDGSSFVRVLDRGRGMTGDVLRNALLPFYSTKHQGSGIGLPLCREIIEAHGGSLRIQNREGGGTAISFRLPPAPA